MGKGEAAVRSMQPTRNLDGEVLPATNAKREMNYSDGGLKRRFYMGSHTQAHTRSS